MEELKKISIEDFRNEGFLQELNRQFLHPLGLALEVTVDDFGKEIISGVWDYRDDPEGITCDLLHSDEERILKFNDNAKKVEAERKKHAAARMKLFGNNEYIEQIPDLKKCRFENGVCSIDNPQAPDNCNDCDFYR